jgi:hypothetical protein
MHLPLQWRIVATHASRNISGRCPRFPAIPAWRPYGAFVHNPTKGAIAASSETNGARLRARRQGFRRILLDRRSWYAYHNDGRQVVQSQGRTSRALEARPGV